MHTRPSLNRDDLLDAVAHIKAEGLRGFILRGAALAAGTTHKVLLYHFGSSDELIIEALDLIRERLTAAGTAAIDALPDTDLDEWLGAIWARWSLGPHHKRTRPLRPGRPPLDPRLSAGGAGRAGSAFHPRR